MFRNENAMRNVKACIMAGGKGTRLHPLTQDMPKPLALLLGKPVLFYILDLLETHQVKEAVLTLGYQGHCLKREVIQNAQQDIEIDFSFEETPLGTAGGVKHAMVGCDSDILVISGDAMCDFDLTKAIAFHRANDSMVTILTSCVADPREYGLIDCDQNGKIRGFVEKPSYHSCSTDMASTGIYILKPQVLDYIVENKMMDFAKDIFPMLLQEGHSLYACNLEGYWCDIGDIKSYMQCQRDMLNGKVKCKFSSSQTHRLKEQDSIDENVYIGAGVTIGKGTTISEGSVICDNVTIGENCTIQESILLNGASVGDNCKLLQGICCTGAWLGKDVTLYEEAVVGAHAMLDYGVVVLSGVHIWNNKKVPRETVLQTDVRLGIPHKIEIEDEGISGYVNGEITPAFCSKIGGALAVLSEESVVMVGCDETKSGQALYHALVSGIATAGASAWCLGKSIESQFRFCLAKSMARYGVYVEGGMIATIHIFEQGGMPTKRETERNLENMLNHDDCKMMQAEHFGTIVPMHSLKKLYDIELLKASKMLLENLAVTVNCANQELKAIMEDSLQRLGCVLGGETEIRLSHDGNKASLYEKNHGIVSFEQMQIIAALEEFQKGETVSVEQTAPKVFDQLAQQYGQTLYRYCQCPCDNKDQSARLLAVQKPFLRDGAMLSLRILAYMKQEKLDIKGLLQLIPHFGVSSRLIAVSSAPTRVMKSLNAEKKVLPEGTWVSKDGKQAILRPIKSGKGIMVFSEGEKAEIAIEICDFFEHLIKDMALDSQ